MWIESTTILTDGIHSKREVATKWQSAAERRSENPGAWVAGCQLAVHAYLLRRILLPSYPVFDEDVTHNRRCAWWDVVVVSGPFQWALVARPLAWGHCCVGFGLCKDREPPERNAGDCWRYIHRLARHALLCHLFSLLALFFSCYFRGSHSCYTVCHNIVTVPGRSVASYFGTIAYRLRLQLSPVLRGWWDQLEGLGRGKFCVN
jgi:hypothetical protein